MNLDEKTSTAFVQLASIENRVTRIVIDDRTHDTSYERPLQEFVLRNDGNADIAFTGFRLGWASSIHPKNNKRWTDLNLYVTETGRYICEEIGRSTEPGETNRCTVEVADSLPDVFEFFGYGWLAKKLYDHAQVNLPERVA